MSELRVRRSILDYTPTPWYVYDVDTGIVQHKCATVAEAMQLACADLSHNLKGE
jgi:hypothetical protein